MSNEDIKAGFVGLGIMGEPMAMNILKEGFEITVYNRTPAKADHLSRAGARVARSPAEVAAAGDVVVSCVTADEDVIEVMLNEQTGIVAGAHDGLIAVDCSTVSPPVAGRCSEALGANGAAFLDAPISGGQGGAQAGTLSIMVGGRKEDFTRAMPVLEAMGRTITYCGPSGSGYTTKLCNQILGGLHLLAAAEALTLAERSGVDLQAVLQAVCSGAAASWILQNLGPKMISGDNRAGFFVDYQLKDLRLAVEAARKLGINLKGANLAETMFDAASQAGYGKDGTQALYHVVRELSERKGDSP